MADKVVDKYIPTSGIGMEIDAMVAMVENQRKSFERRWYDNNFFDDGYHFRYISRTTGKIIDSSSIGDANLPQRAIPKASRQIRGIANLLLGPDYTPVVYPEKVSMAQFPPITGTDPQTGQQISQPNPDYQKSIDVAKETAKKVGHYIMKEWEKQELKEKLTLMLLLAAKNGISFLQVWPDAVEEKIKTQVYDAFDIYLLGSISSIYDSPFIIKTTPRLISVIKANENYDKDQLNLINPDNKYASSEIKQAYMQARYGSGMESDKATTLILKEAFIKEYVGSENMGRITSKNTDVLKGKKIGDMIIRHVFSAGGVWLLDEYIGLPEYPFVDFRFEPGPIYGKTLMENFIPANKSLDIVMSRVERFANTMVTGTWLTRKGENLQISNLSGGQKLEYTQTPPVQGNIANIPPFMFQYIQLLNSIIEEQGASTSALGVLPDGVKSGIAIESVKSTEYANLKIASDQLKSTIKRTSERMIDIASDFVMPQTVYVLEKGNPSYFDIIGQNGIDVRNKIGEDVSQMIPIKKDYLVDIQVESGLGFTQEGKKQTMQQIITFFEPLMEKGLISQDALKVLVRSTLETFQYGNAGEFVEAMDTGMSTAPMTGQQIDQMKIAVLEVLKEAGVVGPQADQKFVDSTKVGVLEAMKDTGALSNVNKQNQSQTPKEPSESISFKDLPISGKQQMAEHAGIQLDPNELARQEQLNQKISSISSKGGQ